MDETSEGTNESRFNNFKGGSIYWLPATGSRVVPNTGFLLPLMVPPPSTSLISNHNYFLGDGGNVLTDISVTINFDFDLTSSANGLGFQVDTYSEVASAKLTPTWQQYIIYLEPNNTQLWAWVDNWYGTYPAGLKPEHDPRQVCHLLSTPQRRRRDHHRVCYTFTDPTGKATSTTINLADATVYRTSTKVTYAGTAPILALTVNIVGDYNGNAATLTDGEGRISYSCAQPLTVLSTERVILALVMGGLLATYRFAQWFGLTHVAGLVPMVKQETRRPLLPPLVAFEQKDVVAAPSHVVKTDGGEL